MFFEQLSKICKDKNTSPSSVAMKIGKSKSAVTRWKAGQEPSLSDAARIAEILNVEIKDLIDISSLGGEMLKAFSAGFDASSESNNNFCEACKKEKPVTISDDGLSAVQKANIELLKQLSPEKALQLQGYIQGLLDAQKG